MEIIKESTEDFFKKGRKIARLADAQKPIPESYVLSFDDPQVFSTLISPAKLRLIASIREEPGSISVIAKKLHRDASSVSKDISLLEGFGLVAVKDKTNPGHGKIKEVSATSKKILFSF